MQIFQPEILLLGKYYANEKRKVVLLLPTYTVIAKLNSNFITSYEIKKFQWNKIKLKLLLLLSLVLGT